MTKKNFLETLAAKKELIIFFLAVVFLLLSANLLLRSKAGAGEIRETEEILQKKDIPAAAAINDGKGADNRYGFAFSQNQKKEMIAYAYKAVDDYVKNGSLPDADFEDIDFEYDKVFVTFINNGEIRCCMSGTADPASENRLAKDLKTAVEKCANDERFQGKLKVDELPDLSMTIDFLYNEKPLAGHSVSDLEEQLEMGLNAIRISQGGKAATFKASVPIEKDYTLAKTLNKLCIKAKLVSDCYGNEDTKISKFDSINFKGGRNGEITDLYRSNVLIEEKNIDKERVMQSIMLGYQWFKNNIDPETNIPEYLYLPSSDSYDDSVNHIRILASNWAIAEIMGFLGSDSMEKTVRSTLDTYFAKYRKQDPKGIYLSVEGEPKIAYNAFTLMALINYKNYPDREKIMDSLANRILAQQQPDGRLLTDFESGGESGIDFYAGESLLALAKYYYETGDKKYYDAVAKAFPYYRDYWRSHKNTAFVPWQTQTYYLMYKKDQNTEWADFVFEMNDWLIDNYQQLESEYPDYLGGFKEVPGNSTSAYAEGVCDAYALARIANDKEHEEKFLRSARLAVRFVMQAQLTNENTFYYKNTQKAAGGFRMSLLDNKIRCDNNQHAILSLIKAVNYGVY